MSTIKSSSEDLTLNADGSNEVKFQINAVEKASINSSGLFTSTTIDATALTGNLPAISGASLTGLPAAGEKRNYIIDGDFTQWPEGTAARTFVNNKYLSALWKTKISYDGTNTGERSTDVPTLAESGNESTHSLLIKCTGTDASIGAGQFFTPRYTVTGTDLRQLMGQEVTFSFWAKTAANNSGDTYAVGFHNTGRDRSYVTEFTPTSSWTQFTKTVTLTDTGSWNFDEASDGGLLIHFALVAGSTYHTTADTWQSTQEYGTSSTSNFMASTSNEFYISQVGLYLGSTAPTFTSPPISTVKNQVDYYVERWDFTQTNGYIVLGRYHGSPTGTKMRSTFQYRTPKRILAGVSGSGASTWEVRMSSGALVPSAVTFDHVTNFGFRGSLTTSAVTGDAVGTFADAGSGTAYILIDARH